MAIDDGGGRGRFAGTPNSIEVISPVVFVTADMPKRKANAWTAFILKTNGSINANVVGPPRPGRMPTMNPTAIQSSSIRKSNR